MRHSMICAEILVARYVFQASHHQLHCVLGLLFREKPYVVIIMGSKGIKFKLFMVLRLVKGWRKDKHTYIRANI